MNNLRTADKNRRTKNLTIAVVMLLALAACGGGGGGRNNGDSTTAGSSVSDNTSSSSANVTAFDSIFAEGTGTGFNLFGTYWPSYTTGDDNSAKTWRTRFYVKGADDTSFSSTSLPITGGSTVALNIMRQMYYTADGVFNSQEIWPSGIGSGTQIWQRTAQGYQVGINGMSGPLYDITLESTDISGVPVRTVVARDETTGNGLNLLHDDDTPMPPGSVVYQRIGKVMTSFVAFNTVGAPMAVGMTLDQWAERVGGTVQTLGGSQYVLTPVAGSVAYVDYAGGIRTAYVYNPGDTDDGIPSGYNDVAADFLAHRMQTVAGQ